MKNGAASDKLVGIANSLEGREKIDLFSKSMDLTDLSLEKIKGLQTVLMVFVEAIHKKANSDNPSIAAFSYEMVHGVIPHIREQLNGPSAVSSKTEHLHPEKLVPEEVEEEAKSFAKDFSLDQIKKLRIRWDD